MAVEAQSSRILLTGDNHNCVKQFPMFGKGAPIYWWAERGLVHWEDARDPKTRRPGMYGSMSWQEAAHRVLAISAMVANSPSSSKKLYADERSRLQQFVSDMEGVIRQAKEQGGPWDKGAGAEHARRRAKKVLMPSRPSNVIKGDGDVDYLAKGQKPMQRIKDPFAA